MTDKEQEVPCYFENICDEYPDPARSAFILVHSSGSAFCINYKIERFLTLSTWFEINSCHAIFSTSLKSIEINLAK